MFERKMKTYENNKSLVINIAGSIGVKGLSLIVNLITMPAYMTFFENQQILGVWFSLLSILNWILIFDVGIGNGLRNHLVTAFVDKNYDKAKKLISSAYVSIGIVSFIILIIGVVIINVGNWNQILNISKSVIDNRLLISSIIILFMGIMVQFFLKLILSIMYAMQKPALSNLVSLLSQSSILIFVLLFNILDLKGDLVLLSVFYTLSINVPLVIATVYLFYKPLKKARPSFKFYSKEYSSLIMTLGYKFFWIQLALLIINSSNEFMITRLFGPEDVVTFQVYNRIFSLFLMFFSILTVPIWSSITQAIEEKRFKWIKGMYKNLNWIALLLSVGCILIVPFLQIIINVWLGNDTIIVSASVSFLFALFNIIMMFINSATSISNGLGKLNAQFVGNTIAAILKIPLSIYLANIIGIWYSIMIANIVVMLPVLVLQVIDLRKQFNKFGLEKELV